MTPGGRILIACDLDGTLLDSDGAPVAGVGDALAGMVADGAFFVVVTGRPLRTATNATAALGVTPAVYVSYHGALITDPSGRILRHVPLPVNEARELTRHALAEGVAVTVWDLDRPVELEPVGGGQSSQSLLPGHGVSRLILHAHPSVVTRLFAAFQGRWRGRLQVRLVRPGYLEVLALAVDKADALRFVTGRLGVAPELIVACGDDLTDESLLATAAVRIAVGEPPHPLRHVPRVTVVSQERLAEALRTQYRRLLQGRCEGAVWPPNTATT